VAAKAEKEAAKMLAEAKPLVGSEPVRAVELLMKSVVLDARGTQCFTLLAKAHVKVCLAVTFERTRERGCCGGRRARAGGGYSLRNRFPFKCGHGRTLLTVYR
jgi:hypothetical protein